MLAEVTGQQFESLKAELQGQGQKICLCLQKSVKAKALMKVVIGSHGSTLEEGILGDQEASLT